MTTTKILAELKSLGTEQNRKTYRRHGVPEDTFGVSYANQDKLAKRLRKEADSKFAIDLWEKGNHDGKILAAKILKPEWLSRSKADSLIRGSTHGLQAGELAKVLSRCDFAPDLVEKWIAASPTRSPWKVYCGWTLLSEIAIAKKQHLEITDRWFLTHLKTIEQTIHETPNDIREQMNSTVIAIGSRNQQLRKRATAAAKRIGVVEVDHGETSCKTPDAVSYIEKVWQRKEKRKT